MMDNSDKTLPIITVLLLLLAASLIALLISMRSSGGPYFDSSGDAAIATEVHRIYLDVQTMQTQVGVNNR